MPDVSPSSDSYGGRTGHLVDSGPWRKAVEERRRACRAAGASYHLMMAPARRDAAPPPLALELIGDDLVLDPGPGLRARRRIAETWLQSGAGWTDYGAYAASLDLIEALRPDLDVARMPEAALEFWEEKVVGDLAAAAPWPSPSGPEPEVALRVLPPDGERFRRVFGGSDQDGGGAQVFEHQDGSLPRMLALAARGPAWDCLARMLPFLCGRFSRVVAVTSPDLFLDLLESEQPAAVFKLAAEAEFAAPPALMRRDFEDWSGLRLPLHASAPSLEVEFGQGGGAERVLRDGWSRPEPGRRWSLGAASTLVVAGPLAGAHELSIELAPCVFPPELSRQRLAVEANGAQVAAFDLAGAARIRVELPGPVIAAAPELTLRFLHPDFVIPAAIGRNGDDRPLAFCFGRLELRPRA